MLKKIIDNRNLKCYNIVRSLERRQNMNIEAQIALLNQRIQKLSSNGKNVENMGVLRSLVRERRNLLKHKP